MPELALTNDGAAGANASAIPLASLRLESIDLLRGVVMILMALDHTRDFFVVPGVNPTNPAQTTIPLFFTRWITHFCAPVFFLLTGTGALHRSTFIMKTPQYSVFVGYRRIDRVPDHGVWTEPNQFVGGT
jgi:uncharacterized membrane protein